MELEFVIRTSYSEYRCLLIIWKKSNCGDVYYVNLLQHRLWCITTGISTATEDAQCAL